MVTHNTDQFVRHLELAYSLLDTVIAALDHPDGMANTQSMIDCLELSGWHINLLRDQVLYAQSNIIPIAETETV
ncbi:MAG: hypothetical protein IJ881_04295 [Neisseriaceae bacterium]|nr:hypothetical protein [Neisseriaceae bacterium]MBR3425535.1 hypothetical protein [Neisseriaceae bacterium]